MLLAPLPAGDQQDDVRGRLRAEVGDHFGAGLAGPGGGHAQFDQPPCRKQAWRVEGRLQRVPVEIRSEEHTSELQSLMRISYAVFCLKKKKKRTSDEKTKD